MVAPDLFRRLAALGAALLLPTAAGVGAWRRMKACPAEASPSRGFVVWGRAVLWVLATSGLSALGALLIVGLLADQAYMAAVRRFTGVKVSLLLPLLMVGAVVLMEPLGKGSPTNWKEAVSRWREALRRPLLWQQAGGLLLLLVVLALLLMRSGNEAVLVTSWERRFREALERWLWVRPRAKEWLVGHPTMLLAFALAPSRRRGWTPYLLLAGMVGQVSLVNTFCHVHTPLLVSLVRTLHGLWMGTLLGSALWLLVSWWDARRPAPSSEAGPEGTRKEAEAS
jgi:hypothetical protein